MLAWNPHKDWGAKRLITASARLLFKEVLDETVRLFDGSSAVTQRRIRLASEMETLETLVD